ncbi:MAG TPA: MarR family winged helix-turn-helix transcriptional regulator [Polyangia bacterium]|nr:MarR family winged helix-turn-helix transcriptional regulator [Polyangia bacterium]
MRLPPSRSKPPRRPSMQVDPYHRPSREETLAALIVQARRQVASRVERSLEDRRESIHLYRILAHLIRNGTSTQKQLAEATSQHAAGVSRLLYQLDRRGMVKRRRHALDRREIQVDVTAAGRARFRQLAPVVGSAVKQALAPMPAGDQARMIASLRKLLAGSDKVDEP